MPQRRSAYSKWRSLGKGKLKDTLGRLTCLEKRSPIANYMGASFHRSTFGIASIASRFAVSLMCV